MGLWGLEINPKTFGNMTHPKHIYTTSQTARHQIYILQPKIVFKIRLQKKTIGNKILGCKISTMWVRNEF